ncbi:unnamed protein product [Fructobacillus fructosus]|uniref:Uncharacterized protein n=1 Tax=Fructobacillus fructosus TaxID=1631 RepID=A0ABM9MLG3_9LACO|nr:unnamed protein product [Fructobacillus fructosus]CAK1234426.1 unnamed protein product [Fructobacillus fructosus]
MISNEQRAHDMAIAYATAYISGQGIDKKDVFSPSPLLDFQEVYDYAYGEFLSVLNHEN